MNYYSILQPQVQVSFKDAAILGQAPDKGLFFPTNIPRYTSDEWRAMFQLAANELGYQIMRPYVGDAIPEQELKDIIAATLSFPFPLVPIAHNIYALELFHGPTLAFKDVGARFMSRCLGYFFRNQHSKLTVLVATSGDTGGAVASGFLGVEGVEVIILYPKGRVSPVQELQLTSCGENITALAVEGTFDDCQQMVKEAFMDKQLSALLQLTSANSINIARWLPQQLYYILAMQQWPQHLGAPVIAVPSGNFGNLCAGLVAHQSGLPIHHFIAACNVNDAVIKFLAGAAFAPAAATATLSNAMDVGNPSNFIRIIELFQQNNAAIRQLISGYTITDEETLTAIAKLYQQYQYIADPHGAVAFSAVEKYLEKFPNHPCIFLETAHPVKFPETVEKVIGKPIQLPPAAIELMKRTGISIPIAANYSQFKDWLLSR